MMMSVMRPPPMYIRASCWSVDGGTTAPGVMRLRRSLRWRRGAVAEWLGRGLQSLAHRFDSGPRLEARYDEGSGA